MRTSSVPAEPVVLAFDPEKSEVPEMRKVFADEVARQLWLGIKPGHVTSPDFNEYCLLQARRIRNIKPSSPENLRLLLQTTTWSTRSSGHIFDNFDDFRTMSPDQFLMRLFEAVTGSKPFTWKIVLPGTEEESELHRQEHARGYADGNHGRLHDGWSDHYRRGYQLGAYYLMRSQENETEDEENEY